MVVAGPHGRFLILTDEHVPLALVKALPFSGWKRARRGASRAGQGHRRRIVFAHAGNGARRFSRGYNRGLLATAAKLVYSHITKHPEVCGGRATIDGTRIRVLDIWSLKQRGLTPVQMLEEYPLTVAQVHAALSYAYENLAEIEAALEEDDWIGERIQRDREESLKKSQ